MALSGVRLRVGAALIATALVCACGGGGGHSASTPAGPTAQPTTPSVGPGSQPTIAPSPTASSTANPAAFVCPNSDSAASVASGGGFASETAVRRTTSRLRPSTASTSGTQFIAVTYNAATEALQRTTLSVRASALGMTPVKTFNFDRLGVVTHVFAVPAAKAAATMSTLRNTPGVQSVGLAGAKRYTASVNDPYFTGFSTTNPVNGVTPPATFGVGPYEENADVPGQWDMHAIRLDNAFAQTLGSNTVKIAIIDTGEDINHPELASKIAYQKCFITSDSTPAVTSVSSFSADPTGHGTDVAGIAAEATNNAFGFAGAGGNSVIYAYRVFPTPDDKCANETQSTDDSQCSTNTTDIASAINDAVAQGVDVISMSLGGGGCVNNADPTPDEGNAVANAIAHNIVVVAAAGNANGPPVESPGCDPGVIAVGATALDDGQTNGSSHSGGTATAPVEYVASYTDYGVGDTLNSASSWGIVAPGGDPIASGNDNDNLHWIENIWTTNPFMANANDQSFQGNCNGDYPAGTGTADCRVLIAGTSMATPHVAGVAALVIAVNPAYKAPGAMKQLLCATADDIGDPNQGCGRLDAYRAVTVAAGGADPGPSAILRR